MLDKCNLRGQWLERRVLRMYRTIVIFIAVAFLAGWTAVGETVVLNEMIPWPLLSAGIAVETVLLTDEPVEPLAGWREWASNSAYQIRFGLMPIGTSEDPGISFAFLQGATPQIVVDADNNENLVDNDIVTSREQIDSRSYTWFVTVVGEYQNGDSVVRSQLHINITALYSYELDDYIVGYSGFCQRRGILKLEGISVPIAITSLLSNGTYDVSHLVVAVDGDFDGRIDSLPGSHEVFGPGEDVQIGTTRYRITSVSAWGETLSLEEIGSAPARPRIARGELAPAFSTISISGERLDLSMFKGQAVVLYFLPTLAGGACDTCVTNKHFLKRLVSIYNVLRSLRSVTMIAVVPGKVAREELNTLPSTGIYYVVDPALTSLYRRTYGLIIIAPDGTIAAMDEAWAAFRCIRPHGEFDELRVDEIEAVVQRLLRGNQGL